MVVSGITPVRLSSVPTRCTSGSTGSSSSGSSSSWVQAAAGRWRRAAHLHDRGREVAADVAEPAGHPRRGRAEARRPGRRPRGRAPSPGPRRTARPARRRSPHRRPEPTPGPAAGASPSSSRQRRAARSASSGARSPRAPPRIAATVAHRVSAPPAPIVVAASAAAAAAGAVPQPAHGALADLAPFRRREPAERPPQQRQHLDEGPGRRAPAPSRRGRPAGRRRAPAAGRRRRRKPSTQAALSAAPGPTDRRARTGRAASAVVSTLGVEQQPDDPAGEQAVQVVAAGQVGQRREPAARAACAGVAQQHDGGVHRVDPRPHGRARRRPPGRSARRAARRRPDQQRVGDLPAAPRCRCRARRRTAARGPAPAARP